MKHGTKWIGVIALLTGSFLATGCCGGGKSGDSDEPAAKAKLGERFPGPGSDFSVVVDQVVVTEAIGDTKPSTAGAKWVIAYYKIKNDGKEPKDSLLVFSTKVKDKAGTTYETSPDGGLALAIAEPEASSKSLDKVPVGEEIKQVAVFAIPAEKVKEELELIFSEAIALGTPKSTAVTFTATEKAPAAAPSAPAEGGTATPPAEAATGAPAPAAQP